MDAVRRKREGQRVGSLLSHPGIDDRQEFSLSPEMVGDVPVVESRRCGDIPDGEFLWPMDEEKFRGGIHDQVHDYGQIQP